MAIIKIETKNQRNINQKPRVYFTCHPADFEKYFRKFCDDIFVTHDSKLFTLLVMPNLLQGVG